MNNKRYIVIYSNASIQTPENGQWIYNTAAVHYAEEFYLHDVTKDNIMKFFSGRERDWDCRKLAWIDDSHEDEGVYVLRIQGSGNLPFYWFMLQRTSRMSMGTYIRRA